MTIIQQPSGLLQSANNDSVFVITGSSGYTSSVFDFKYLADVMVDGKRTCTLTTFPDPAYGFGVFNLRNIIPNFVSFDFIPTLKNDSASIFYMASNSAANVYLSFGREFIYNNVFTQSRGEITSSMFSYINSSKEKMNK